MDTNDDVYLLAVDAAMRKAGVLSDRAAHAVATRIFQAQPALADVAAFLDALKTQLPSHFTPPVVPASPALAAPREAVKNAYFLATLPAQAGHKPPAPVAVETPPSELTVLRHDDPNFAKAFAAHAEAIAAGKIRVV